MHPYIPADNVVEARLQYVGLGGVMENVLHFYRNAEWDLDGLTALGDNLKSWWHSMVRANVSDTVSLQRIVLTVLTTATGLQLTYTTDLPDPGTDTSLPLPSNATAAISLRSASRGRSARGRYFRVGLTIGAIAGDLLTTGAQDVLIAEGAALRAFSDGTGAEYLVVLSYCSEGEWRTAALYFPVETVAVDRPLDSMRRRLYGRGV